MATPPKILKISIISVLSVLLFTSLGYIWWINSPNFAFYNFSKAIIKRDFNEFSNYLQLNSIIQNNNNSKIEDFLFIGEKYFNTNIQHLGTGYLALNYIDTFNSDKLSNDGNKFFTVATFVPPYTLEKKVFGVRFIFENVNNWKVTNIIVKECNDNLDCLKV
jgi:hypothetical protein